MKIAWCAFLGLALACEPQVRDGAPTGTSPAASVRPGRIALPAPASPPSPSAAPVDLPTPAKSPIDVADASLPRHVVYTHEVPRVGTPAASAFTRESASGGEKSDAGRSGMVIDERGAVWRFIEINGQVSSHRVGRLPLSDVLRMRGLVAAAAGKATIAEGPACIDCGYSSFFAYGVPGARKQALKLASLSPTLERIDSAPIEKVVGWIRAIDWRALQAERRRPFGLVMPIVKGLTDIGDPQEEPAAVVFELQRRVIGQATGALIDARGGVYRFHHRGDEPRAVRRVGSVDNIDLHRATRLAERARQEAWQDESGGRVCTTIQWNTALASDPTQLSDDCSGRFSGKNADALIAWVYAIDEQAPPVVERKWPPPHR